ncbi:MAG TPA: DUF4153 domain-containing protein [Bacteroidia bacterium]|nr:DUF4153 domain-containing protein [Bacteroidia bacterium]
MKIKLVSLNQLFFSAKEVFLRFPLAVIASFVAAVTAMILVEQKSFDLENSDYLIKLFLTSFLALPFFISVEFITETISIDKRLKIIFHIIGLILVFLYYWTFDIKIQAAYFIRTYVLSIALHLFVAYSPYISNYNENGFWQFNKTLFLRFLLSVLYSVVLFSGLSIAILAIDKLFDIKVSEKVYAHLWILISIIFNTFFFLAGIPKNVRELDTDYSYPKGLKIFTQFVLLPLVTVYLIILYLYLIKIILSWELPRGWVSFLVMSFSVFGIFSLLMIYPIKDNEENKWINIYSRWYFRLLFPLILLTAVAVYVRVSNYGITEYRYFLIVLTLWLFVIDVYFLFSKNKKIILIPFSLSIIAILSVFGPLSAFSISERSQIKRLEKLLLENNLLQNGKIVPAKGNISRKAEAEIASIIRYLDNNYGFKNIQKWFDKDLEKLFAEKKSLDKYTNEADIILKEMGLQNIYEWEINDESSVKYFSFFVSNDSSIQINGFDEIVEISAYSYEKESMITKQIILNKDTLKFTLNTLKDNYIFFDAKDKKVTEFGINSFVKEIKEKTDSSSYSETRNIPSNMMYKDIKTESYHFKLFFKSIQGQIRNDSIIVQGIDVVLLIAYPNGDRKD